MGLIRPHIGLLVVLALLSTHAAAKHSTVIWKELSLTTAHPVPNETLLTAATAAAATWEPVSRELAIKAALTSIKVPIPPSKVLQPGSPGALKLPYYTALWIELASQQMQTKRRDLNELVHALLHEQERRRAHCRNQAARTLSKLGRLPLDKQHKAAWNALSDARVTCGETSLSLIAKQAATNEDALRTALLEWPGLERACSGISEVVKHLEKWSTSTRSKAIDRRCRPRELTIDSVEKTPPMALLFTYVLARQLSDQNLLTSAHLKILSLAR